MVIGLPATAVGAAVMLSAFVEIAEEQGALPVAVKVRVTPPDRISDRLGVYVHCGK